MYTSCIKHGPYAGGPGHTAGAAGEGGQGGPIKAETNARM